MEAPFKNKIDVEKKVRTIVAEKLGLDEIEITPQFNYTNDNHIDSLDMIEVILEFEKVFGITISEIEAIKYTTVAESIDRIWEKSKLQYRIVE